MNQTKDYVDKAVVSLKKAREHHRCTRKWLCWLIIIGILVLIGVILGIAIPLAIAAKK